MHKILILVAAIVIIAASVLYLQNAPFTPAPAPVSAQDTEPLGQATAHDPGSAKPDLALVVSESIQGTWQSADDEKYIREFRENNIVIDYYDGAQTMESEWYTFTNKTGLHIEVPYPLEDDTAYIMVAADHEALFFKVTKLTPEELDLVFLNRGGVLRFLRSAN